MNKLKEEKRKEKRKKNEEKRKKGICYIYNFVESRLVWFSPIFLT